MIEVVSPGFYSSIQDRGRPGHYGIGLPPSGAMDMYAHDCANALVGNTQDAATIEATFVGPTVIARFTTLVAVTGAEIRVTLDGEPMPMWTSQVVRAGQSISFGAMTAGSRAYFAVRGGIDVPPVMGSRSTYPLSGLGGLEGRILRAGDLLPVGESIRKGTRLRGGVQVPESLRPRLSEEIELRVVPGLCDYRLTREAQDVLYSSPFQVTAEANRTGYRLQGETLQFSARKAPFGAGDDPSNVVNLGYPIGSIQAPSGSELICLMRDAVTGGGYATIGTVISADLDRIAQAKTSDQALFCAVDVSAALAERAAVRDRLAKVAALVLA